MPTSSQTAYLLPLDTNPSTPELDTITSFTALLTTGDAAGFKDDGVTPYRLAGIPDGIGAFDNMDGTFTVVMNHELGATAGIVRDHGSVGAFITALRIDKVTLQVLDAKDLIEEVNLYNPATGGFTSGTTAFGRLCSADLADASAFYNPVSGLGYNGGRIFLNGEESGIEGRAFAHFATGLQAGNSFELAALGNFSWENAVANPRSGDRTVVAGMDDGQNGQVYFYQGDKKATGTNVDKAGLTGGITFGISVAELGGNNNNEPSTASPLGADEISTFSMVNLGDVTTLTGAQLDAASEAAGVTTFLRPEDGAWDTINPNRFYFATTNAFNQPSRLWAADFVDSSNVQLGGTIRLLLNGTEGQQMMDNLTVDSRGHVLLQEDVGNNAFLGRILDYDPVADTLTPIARHDPARFLSGGANFLTQDEESSGIVDVTHILGNASQSVYLLDVQAHFPIAGELVEGGQLLLMRSNTFGGNDLFPGTSGDDSIRAGAGNDTVLGGAGRDLLFGEAGDDVLGGGTVPAGQVNQLSGGDGNDTATYADMTGLVYADLRTRATHVDGVLTDMLDTIENLTGGSGNDVLIGGNDSVGNVLIGGAGADELYGLAGDDVLVGGSVQSGRVNQLFGGEGTDTASYIGTTGRVYADLRTGAALVDTVVTDILSGIENLVGGSGNDLLIGADGASNTLFGGAGADELYGLGGNDLLVGGTVPAGSVNQLFGGDGTDTASYGGTTGSVRADLRAGRAEVDGVLTDLLTGIENLVGGAGADSLAGDDGANRLTGGGGVDVLYGFGGQDTFAFATASDSRISTGYDVIADFQTGLDRVDLTAFGITASNVLIVTDTSTTALFADTDASLGGYELAVAFLGQNAVTVGDLIF